MMTTLQTEMNVWYKTRFQPYLSIPVAVNQDRINPLTHEMWLYYGDHVNGGSRTMYSCPYNIQAGETLHFEFFTSLHESWPIDLNVSCLMAQWRQNPGSPKISLQIHGDQWVWKNNIDVKNPDENQSRSDLTPIGYVQKGYDIEDKWNLQIDFGNKRGSTHIWRNDNLVFADEETPTMFMDDKKDAHCRYTSGMYNPNWNNKPLKQGDPGFRRMRLWWRMHCDMVLDTKRMAETGTGTE